MTTVSSISTIEAKEEFSDVLNRVSQQKERIILTRRDKPIAVMIPIDDWMHLQQSQSKQDLDAAVCALKEARDIGTVSLEELKIQLGIAS